MRRLSAEVVVDSSVAVKFLVRETDSDKADALFERANSGAIRLLFLDLLFMETANALWVKVRRSEMDQQEAEERIRELLTLSAHVTVIPAMGLLAESFKAACRHGQAVYDAVFLALAQDRGISFVTADRKFWHRIQPHFSSAILLRDLEA